MKCVPLFFSNTYGSANEHATPFIDHTHWIVHVVPVQVDLKITQAFSDHKSIVEN